MAKKQNANTKPPATTPSLADIVRGGGSQLQNVINAAKQIQSQGGSPQNVIQDILNLAPTASYIPAPPAPNTVSPGQVNVGANNFGAGGLANLVSQKDKSALQAAIDQAKVLAGLAGAPELSFGQQPYAPWQIPGISGDFYNVAGNWVPSTKPLPGYIIHDGQYYDLPSNYVNQGGVTYKYENGQWQNVSNQGGIWESLPQGWAASQGITNIPTAAKPAPPRFDFAGNPLGPGGQVYTTPGTNSFNPIAGSTYTPPPTPTTTTSSNLMGRGASGAPAMPVSGAATYMGMPYGNLAGSGAPKRPQFNNLYGIGSVSGMMGGIRPGIMSGIKRPSPYGNYGSNYMNTYTKPGIMKGGYKAPQNAYRGY